MKKFLPSLLIVSLFVIGSCAKQKADNFNNYIKQANAIEIEAGKMSRSIDNWFISLRGKFDDKAKAEMKNKIKGFEAMKAKLAAIKTPNAEIKKFQDIQLEMYDANIAIFKIYVEIMNHPEKAKDLIKKTKEQQDKYQKLSKEFADLRLKYAKKHGLLAK